ncbi:PREDICTED: uncharacterized protein LOC105152733 [Acromyrmex echinatior]|uniref:uncharacterized protein LOC105152733 n=1 Tax=Acromyrmex echinatior TaxID=103372 RepID=UPI000581047E|nr:PREDICTED: uncharacterized protein LOC105152733 [Acromyrmex echinatior]
MLQGHSKSQKCRKNLSAFPSIENFISFKKAKASCTRTLYKIKKKQWKKFVKSFDYNDNRQNNLLEKAKDKICLPFCSTNTGKSLSSMIAEDIDHPGNSFQRSGFALFHQ